MRTSYEDVEAALCRLPGVAAASIGTGSRPGKGKLSIRLAAGHDAEAVAVAVSELLRERFGIDIAPERIRPRPVGADEGQPVVGGDNGQPARRQRPAIRDLVVEPQGLEVNAHAVLDLRGRVVRGSATGAATKEAALRAVARATLDAVDRLVPGIAKTDLDSVEISGHGEHRHATVTVTYLTPRGEERLAGVSLMRDGNLDAAVMRATLDAVNRRLEPVVDPEVQSPG